MAKDGEGAREGLSGLSAHGLRACVALAGMALACSGPSRAIRSLCAPEDPDGFEDGDGCADVDDDRDGVADADDLCRCHPEDVDFFEDADGCPERDNDADQLVDACDACPDTPESYDGVDDLDGCPDDAEVRLHLMRSHILPRFEFARGSSRVDPRHYGLLDEIAAAMTNHPELEQVEVQGHAAPGERDPRGLAQRRADVVRDALIARGVDPARLRARSYGADRPIAPPETAHGRNRRVELAILEMAEPEPPPPVEPCEPPPPSASACPPG